MTSLFFVKPILGRRLPGCYLFIMHVKNRCTVSQLHAWCLLLISRDALQTSVHLSILRSSLYEVVQFADSRANAHERAPVRV